MSQCFFDSSLFASSASSGALVREHGEQMSRRVRLASARFARHEQCLWSLFEPHGGVGARRAGVDVRLVGCGVGVDVRSERRIAVHASNLFVRIDREQHVADACVDLARIEARAHVVQHDRFAERAKR